ncbi:MAG: DUF1995 family protein [Cyanobacteria bacterium J083]|nr:MAG: DUF1995 family protein [Cyanobacteria bacterium J083]
MVNIPQNLDDVANQAKIAAKSALDDGYRRVQVELLIPEIALEAQGLALEFASILSEYGSGLKILFTDTGAASLAKRDWGETVFSVTDLGSRRTPVERKISDADEAFIVVCPSAVEVAQVEKLCNLAGDRPVLLLTPQLEDVAVVGIGYAARQLRERFISTLYSAYYYKSVDGAMVLRSHPGLWQVFLQKDTEYELIAELENKPVGEDLERLIRQAINQGDSSAIKAKQKGIFASLQQFLKALSQ